MPSFRQENKRGINHLPLLFQMAKTELRVQRHRNFTLPNRTCTMKAFTAVRPSLHPVEMVTEFGGDGTRTHDDNNIYKGRKFARLRFGDQCLVLKKFSWKITLILPHTSGLLKSIGMIICTMKESL
jgi:hypothetical protein